MECNEPAETSMERRERLDNFMREAAERVEKWPEWKRNVDLMDRDRMYEPNPDKQYWNKPAEATEKK